MNPSPLLKHELTHLPIITKGNNKVMVATWTVNFERDSVAKFANVETIESDKFSFAGHWWKMSLEMNSEFTTKGHLKIVDSGSAPQVSYIVLVFDSTRSIIDYWYQFSAKAEKKDSDNGACSRHIPINETPVNVPNTPFSLSQKSIEAGCFTLCCQLSLFRKYLTDHLKKLKDDEYEDVIFLAQEKKMEAHRFMIASHSSVFHDWLEKGDSVIRLPEFDSEVVDAMLTFIYSKRIPNVEKLAIDLLRMAEKYDIKYFKEQCEKRLCEKICIENAVRLQALAEHKSLGQLKVKTVNFIALKIDAIQATSEWKEMIKEYWLKFEEKNQIPLKRSKPSPM
nr:speckle-type POZ protein-like [Aedes albopictus]XP_029728090.1 speckle-type POZ protein-like [Aedes albopictus]